MRRILFVFFFLLPFSLWAQSPTTLSLLRNLIQIDTSNPPGNETDAARYVQGLLSQYGIDSEIIESELGRGNLIARLKGDGSKPAMILLGHLDVVPAEPSKWEVPPFSAKIQNGEIWGRGALDMKSLIAMEIETFLRLKRENTPLAGDLILVLTADEEAGGHLGAEFLVRNHWDKIEAKYVFNEGSVGVMKDGLHLYPIQTAEKGVAWLKVTAHGTSGHGSRPIEDNAVVHLSEGLSRLAHYSFPIQRTEIVATFLNRLEGHLPIWKSLGLKFYFAPVIGPIVQKVSERFMAKEKMIRAILRNTVTPTMLEAGYKVNVIPAEATASIDARILPGETPEGFRDQIKSILGNSFDVELLTSSRPNESDFKTDYFQVIERAIQKQDSQAVTAPMMSPGATDSRFFREKGVISYGIIPLLLTEEQLEGLHGKNERIPVDQLEKGTQIVYDIVKEMQGK